MNWDELCVCVGGGGVRASGQVQEKSKVRIGDSKKKVLVGPRLPMQGLAAVVLVVAVAAMDV